MYDIEINLKHNGILIGIIFMKLSQIELTNYEINKINF